LFHAIVGYPGGYFEKGDGYVMTSSGLAFDENLYNKYHPDKKIHIGNQGPPVDGGY